MIKRNKGLQRKVPLTRHHSTGTATAGITSYSRAEQMRRRLYGKKRVEFLNKEENQLCKIRANENCQGVATDIQHIRGHGKYLLDTSTWESCCRYCNQFCTDHPEWAFENGHSDTRM
jgi:hypothetical protein